MRTCIQLTYLIFKLVTSSDAYQVEMEVSGSQQKNAVIVNMLYEMHEATTKVCRIKSIHCTLDPSLEYQQNVCESCFASHRRRCNFFYHYTQTVLDSCSSHDQRRVGCVAISPMTCLLCCIVLNYNPDTTWYGFHHCVCHPFKDGST